MTMLKKMNDIKHNHVNINPQKKNKHIYIGERDR